MRLFISINIPQSLHRYCRKLQGQFPGMKNSQEFHLTLQFLGDDLTENQKAKAMDKLSEVQFEPFDITLWDALPFGNPKEPRGVWVECRGGVSLQNLADQVRSAMSSFDLAPDKPFRAHITLGRYKTVPPAIPKPLKGEPHSFTVSEFHLMQSHLSSKGHQYKVLKTFSAL